MCAELNRKCIGCVLLFMRDCGLGSLFVSGQCWGELAGIWGLAAQA